MLAAVPVPDRTAACSTAVRSQSCSPRRSARTPLRWRAAMGLGAAGRHPAAAATTIAVAATMIAAVVAVATTIAVAVATTIAVAVATTIAVAVATTIAVAAATTIAVAAAVAVATTIAVAAAITTGGAILPRGGATGRGHAPHHRSAAAETVRRRALGTEQVGAERSGGKQPQDAPPEQGRRGRRKRLSAGLTSSSSKSRRPMCLTDRTGECFVLCVSDGLLAFGGCEVLWEINIDARGRWAARLFLLALQTPKPRDQGAAEKAENNRQQKLATHVGRTPRDCDCAR